ncbi:hypothetical protein C8R43DRAFT_1018169 [Mycena crocata]|nr:hypothetical protein C8R43DRAFT_1018169 [Mycena crocata]
MRMLGVLDLPPPSETGRCEVVLKCIGKALTDKRHYIKSQIFASLSPAEDGVKVDIAKLTRSCISNSPVQPTVAMYQRLALIRSVATDLKDGENFWATVDKQLNIYYQNFSPSERKTFFEMHYNTDVANHGAADKEIPITLMKDMESWLSTVDMVLEK